MTTLVVAVSLLIPAAPQAQDRWRNFTLPRQSLSSALPEFALQAGLQIISPADRLNGLEARPLRGRQETRAALRRLIAGSGLTIVSDDGAVIVLGLHAAASGQEPDSGLDRPHPLGEVLVTALRREVDARVVPVAVTALDQHALERGGIVRLADLPTAAPGLNMTEVNTGQRRISIRGVQSAGENTVGLYVGETPVSGPNSATSDPSSITPNLDLFDTRRIEVLRGPQGTLFGSGSMSGAVRLLFNEADVSEPSARLGAEVGWQADGADSGSIHGMANLPLIRDRFALRLAAYDVHEGGYVDNDRLGLVDVNGARTRGARLMGRLEANDQTTLSGMGLVQDQRVQDTAVWNPARGEHRQDAYARLPFPNRFTMGNLSLEHRMGPATLTATTSYYDWRAVKYIETSLLALQARDSGLHCARYNGVTGPCDGGQLQNYRDYIDSILPIVGYQPMRVKSWVNEARLDSAGGDLVEWTVGLFLETRRDESSSSTVETDPLTGEIERPLRYTFRRENGVDLSQAAVFGEMGLRITDALHARLGLRSYDYTKTSHAQVLQTSYVNASVAGPETVHRDQSSGWVGRATLSYDLSPESTAYVQYAEGFRPGGVNNTPGLAPEFIPYTPDQLRNFEAGLKFAASDGRLFLNLATYEIRWSDIQVAAQVINFNFIANAGKARIRGVELEGGWVPLPEWTLRGAVALMDGRLASGPETTPFQTVGRAGDRLPNEPSRRVSLSAEYRRDIGRGLVGWATGEYAYVGDSTSMLNANNPYFERIGAYDLTHLRLGLDGGPWSAQLHVENLFDEVGEAWVSSRADYERNTISVTPRRLSLVLTRNW